MDNHSAVSQLSLEEPPHRNSWFIRPNTTLAILWGITTVIIGAFLIFMPDQQIPRLIVVLLFAGYLVWYLVRSGPKAADLPDLEPRRMPWLGFWGRLAAIVILLGLVYLSGIISHPFVNISVFFILVAFGIIAARFRQLTWRLLILALFAGIFVGFSESLDSLGVPAGQSTKGSLTIYYWVIITIPLFLAGGLLLQQTRMARIRFLEGKISLGIRSFLFACALALPASLANLGASTSLDPWMDRWWESFTAFTPGIGEETWARLFLTTLCYAILRPTTNNQPHRAVLAAVLIGVFTHMAIHVNTLELFSPDGIALLFDGVIFGIPLGVLFLKRDFEQAVGYHFFIDFIRFLAALT